MGITTLPNTEFMSSNNYIELFHRKNLQQQLAKEFVESAANATLDMLVDSGEVKTYNDFAANISDRVKENAVEFMCDMIRDLETRLAEYINQINVKPCGALFDDSGFADGNILIEPIPRDVINTAS